MNDTGLKTMHVRRENITAMIAQQDGEPTDLHLSLAMASCTLSRASSVIPNYGGAQLTTTVSVHHHYISNPDASYKGSVHDNIVSPSPLALGKPRHHHIPLLFQTESDSMTVVYPLLWLSQGEMLIELDFARSLSNPASSIIGRLPPKTSMASGHPEVRQPRLVWSKKWFLGWDNLEGKMRFMGLHAIGGDTWEILVA
ncbi:hypothetical protein ARMSODRAFT_978354 [Armillaria solidipes]|uniref:Uncharacterized protein n=1 Tax=Armillaria solidipes TaxID=1076256 RepID=A0A2H3BGR3_9AGAR|nr:hypothetical protein ARMSODRAFT_978354 [Armillaria solidipes]